MLKISTIEKLKDLDIITLEECDKSEQNDNVVRDKTLNKYYKILETEGEIKIELLSACLKALTTIKEIMIGFSILFAVYIIYIYYISSN